MGSGRLPDREEVTDEGQKVSSNLNKDKFKTGRQPYGRNLGQEENREETK